MTLFGKLSGSLPCTMACPPTSAAAVMKQEYCAACCGSLRSTQERWSENGCRKAENLLFYRVCGRLSGTQPNRRGCVCRSGQREPREYYQGERMRVLLEHVSRYVSRLCTIHVPHVLRRVENAAEHGSGRRSEAISEPKPREAPNRPAA